jgi:hypothetical protein
VLDSIRWYADGGERYDDAAAGSDAEGATAPGDVVVVVERSMDEGHDEEW